MQIQDNKHLSDLNHDLKCLEDGGYRYVFIDEVTLLDDFIEGAALFSDIYAASGMKIVLSGTDSLGFIFTEDEELYDRCIMSHTTFIPYREFETVLGIAGIDNYIRYGGTMSRGGTYYNDDSMILPPKRVPMNILTVQLHATYNTPLKTTRMKDISGHLRNYMIRMS